MPKTHQFTENIHGTPINIVISQIQTFKRDDFSQCTSIMLFGGKTVGVSESVDEVAKVVNNA